MKNFFTTSQGFILGAITLSAVSVFAWNVPVSAPPAGNASAPINVSSASQTKLGELIVGKLTSNGPIDVTNDKIINVATPTAPSDGVNKAYVDALGGGGSGSSSYGGGSNDFVWGYTDKHYFITATTHTGNLGGYAGADAKCNIDANAISGKTYHALRVDDAVYNAPGVGLYNDKYGWVNSVLRVVPLYNSNILFNKNYSGNGSQAIHASTVLPDILITAEDASIRYKTAAPSFWIVDGSISNTCNSWTTGSASSIYGGAGIFGVSNYVGHITNNAPLPCNLPQNLLCVEN